VVVRAVARSGLQGGGSYDTGFVSSLRLPWSAIESRAGFAREAKPERNPRGVSKASGFAFPLVGHEFRAGFDLRVSLARAERNPASLERGSGFAAE